MVNPKFSYDVKNIHNYANNKLITNFFKFIIIQVLQIIYEKINCNTWIIILINSTKQNLIF